MIRILLVDDQKSIRERLKSLLETELDFEIVGMVDNGYDAIEQVKLLLPDIVLMDVEMPDIDGVLATKIIAHSSRKTKVLVLTSYDTNDYVSKSIHAGAKGYILKGAPADEIREAIRFVNRGYMQIAPGLFEKFMPLGTNTDGGQLELKSKELDDSTIPTTANRPDFADRLELTEISTIQTAKPQTIAPITDFEQPSELILDITALRSSRKSIGWIQATALVIAGLGMTFSLYLLRQGLNKPTTIPDWQEQSGRLHELPFTGKIEPLHITKIDATSPGFVETIGVRVGQAVKAGDKLLTIHNPDAVKANQAKILQHQQDIATQAQAVLQQQAQQQQQNLQQQQILVSERQAAAARINTVRLAIANYQRNIAPLRQQVATANVQAVASQLTLVPLSQKREAIARAQAIYDRAVASHQRLAEYYRAGAIAQERVAQAEQAMTVAKSDLKIAQADYDSAIASASAADRQQSAQTQATQLQQQLSLTEQAGQLQQLQAQLTTARSSDRQLGVRLAQLQQQRSTAISSPPIAKPILEPVATAITAPIAGTIVELPLGAGERVFVGSKLLGLANTNKLKIGVDLDPQQAALLKMGQRAIVKVSTEIEWESVGKITTIAPPVDRTTQHIEVEFTALTSSATPIGQFGTVYFPK